MLHATTLQISTVLRPNRTHATHRIRPQPRRHVNPQIMYIQKVPRDLLEALVHDADPRPVVLHVLVAHLDLERVVPVEAVLVPAREAAHDRLAARRARVLLLVAEERLLHHLGPERHGVLVEVDEGERAVLDGEVGGLEAGEGLCLGNEGMADEMGYVFEWAVLTFHQAAVDTIMVL